MYVIRNLVSGSEYVGSTIDFEMRHEAHKRELRNGKHHARPLQSALAKYGEGSLVFIPIVVCEREYAREIEQRLIDTGAYKYNISKRANGGPNPGWNQTDEVKARISAARKGKPLSAEHRAKLSASHMGNPGHWTGKKRPETGEKIASALRGRKLSPEHRAASTAGIRAAIADGRRAYRPSEKTIARWREFIRLRDEGMTYAKIGSMYGTTGESVSVSIKTGRRYFEANP